MREFIYRIMTDQAQGVFSKLVGFFLQISSYVYSFILFIRSILYRFNICKRYQLSPPVISVGNMTLGGVGKTPIIQFLAESLRDKNFKPVILTRGYMPPVTGGEIPSSDEFAMLKEELRDIPILKGPDRYRNALQYLKNHQVDIFLLDDGFQHWTLTRNLDIVVINTTNPWGNGFLLPRGILRESWHALKRADIVILTKIDIGSNKVHEIKSKLDIVNPRALILESIHQPEYFVEIRSGKKFNVEIVKNKGIVLISSIGDPKSFEQTLINLQANIKKNFQFMDHFHYSNQNIGDIVRFCQQYDIHTIVTTHKDAVKLRPLMKQFDENIEVLYLKIHIQINAGEEEFFERIFALLHR